MVQGLGLFEQDPSSMMDTQGLNFASGLVGCPRTRHPRDSR